MALVGEERLLGLATGAHLQCLEQPSWKVDRKSPLTAKVLHSLGVENHGKRAHRVIWMFLTYD
eukprot:4230528-Amphidinium_carterae.1